MKDSQIVSIRLPAALVDRLALNAAAEGVSRHRFAVALIASAISDLPASRPASR